MKHTKLYRNQQILILLFFLSLSSCKKLIEIPAPRTEVASSEVFKNEQSALSALTGLYSQLLINLYFTNGGMSVYAGLAADDIYNTINSTDYNTFLSNNIPVSSSVVNSRFWAHAYKNIYHANSIIEGINNSNLRESFKAQVLGEAKFIRAFNYFYLVNLFGDVPVVTTTDYTINSRMPRMDKSSVNEQIVLDLTDAANLLSESYPSTGRARANKWTALALLSRQYLYDKDYSKAEANTTLVINSGVYSLVTNLNNVFLVGSNETIWYLQPAGPTNLAASEGGIFVPSSATTRPTFVLTDFLLSAFELNDQRKVSWTNSNVVSSIRYYYPFKYKLRTSAAITEVNTVFRLSELYLIRAEARAYLDNILGSQQDLNKVRNRANLSNTAANSLPTLIAAIERERQTEFFAEWGHRWLDLKRTGRIDAVLSAEKPLDWQSTDALFPIPYSEMLKNPFLVQNPGY